MDPLRFYRQVMSFGQVLFTILRVISVIGAVCILIGILALSFLPPSLVTVDVTAKTHVSVNLRAILGDTWDETAEEPLSDVLPGGEITEDGVEYEEESETESVENRGLAIAMIPAFVETVLSFALYRFLSHAMGKAKSSPFDRDVAANLRGAGWLLLALGTVPALCGALIRLLTKTGLAQGSFDLYLIFGGFILWALADLLLFIGTRLGAEPEHKPEEPHPDAF